MEIRFESGSKTLIGKPYRGSGDDSVPLARAEAGQCQTPQKKKGPSSRMGPFSLRDHGADAVHSRDGRSSEIVAGTSGWDPAPFTNPLARAIPLRKSSTLLRQPM